MVGRPVSVGRPELCVGVVAVSGAQLLMIRRGTEPEIGQWSLPGGRVEAAESVVSAVVRELAEETGLEGVCGPFMGWVERSGFGHHHVILNFEVTLLGDADPVAGDDASEVRWVPLLEVAGTDLVDGMHAFLLEHGVLPGGPVLGGS